MADKFQVYLDHLIPRMNLRYRRSEEDRQTRKAMSQPEDLPISDFDFNEYRSTYMRKPDFQRATNAWTPSDCVSLLESIVNRQVVPSVIMWHSPDNGYEYVLDGGHRISVVMAWIRDDWGDQLPEEISNMMDEERLNSIMRAAQEVRALVNSKIGSINQYKLAADEFDRIVSDKGSPGQQMDGSEFDRALFYNDFRRRVIKFNVQWVEGNYEIAERSFIKINKSGKQLTDWEIRLIENRNSSFARTVMSITNLDSLPYYWPNDIASEGEIVIADQTIQKINSGIKDINLLLFTPLHRPRQITLRQPFMSFFGQDADKKPYWIAELLTVIEGGQGSDSETDKLLARDNSASAEELINNGILLVDKTLQSFNHLSGRSPLSLGVIPALYFYTRSVRYVRSLLYGFVYWLMAGNKQDILDRKRLFATHREAFEKVLLLYRDDFSTGLSRKSGSGSEVTSQTARYYQDILTLIIEHNDEVETENFVKDHVNLLVEKYKISRQHVKVKSVKSRNFTSNQKAAKNMEIHINHAPKCEICGGMFDANEPSGFLQHDHIQEVFRGGQTVPSNQRVVHNFCNNQSNREKIEAMRSRKETISLPKLFIDNGEIGGVKQLRLFDDAYFSGSSTHGSDN